MRYQTALRPEIADRVALKSLGFTQRERSLHEQCAKENRFESAARAVDGEPAEAGRDRDSWGGFYALPAGLI